MRVERYRRLESGSWEYLDATSGAIDLVTGARLELEELYRGLPD
jgi:hypothetical protein